jgi:hypothetical protein
MSGTNLAAVTGPGTPGGDVWTSKDAGATWTKRTSASSNGGNVTGTTVASDSTGTHLVVTGTDVWTSADSGATWVDRRAGGSTLGSSLAGVASDATGTHLVAFTLYSDLWTSSDAGATWTNRTQGTPASGLEWLGVASDSTGTRLVAINGPSGSPGGDIDGDIWASADSGATWTNQTAGTGASGQQWAAVASSADGAHIVGVSSDPPGAGFCCEGDIWTN